MRAVGSRGYSRMMAVTPSAPAPTEEIDTNMPSTAPSNTVSTVVRHGSSSPTTAPRKASLRFLKTRTKPVAARAAPRTPVMTACAAPLWAPKRDKANRARVVVGRLPAASRPTRR